MKYYDMNLDISYGEIEFTLRDIFDNEAYEAALEEGVSDYDFDEFLYGYADRELEKFEAKREKGVTLQTKDGLVEGWFVGSIEYAVGGDAENGWETDRDMAFMMKNGRVFRAWGHEEKVSEFLKIDIWDLENPKKVGGVIRWDMYPSDWNVFETRPSCVKRSNPTGVALTDFTDTPDRTDCGMSLFVVKHNGIESYVGHNRKAAAKRMKEIRAKGHKCTVTVYPVHRQEEYDTLPF